MTLFSRSFVLIPVLSAVATVGLAPDTGAQIHIIISKPGASVAGSVTLELHGGSAPVPACTGVEACPGAGAHVVVAPAPVAVGPGTTPAALSAGLAAVLTAAGAPTTAGPNGISITPPPGVTHCCVHVSAEDGASGHSMIQPCIVNNIADGVALNGNLPPTGGFTFSKPSAGGGGQGVPALPAWAFSSLALLVLGAGAFVLSRSRGAA